MGDLQARRYKECYVLGVDITPTDVSFIGEAYRLSGRLKCKNKLLVYQLFNGAAHYYLYGDPFNMFDRIVEDCNSNPFPGDTLYINSECKISRDVIRQTGYKITINKEKADYVVIPYKHNYTSYAFDILANKGDDIFLFQSRKKGFRTLSINKGDIKKQLEDMGYTDVVFFDEVVGSECYFIPKFDVYEDIIANGANGVNYIYQKDLRVKPSVELSVETLNVWKNITDDNIKAKLLATSDCTKYPLTLLYFIHTYWWRYIYGISDAHVKRILDIIGYDESQSLTSNMFCRRVVQPDDWNMLTNLILDKVGASEEGGFIADKTFYELDEIERNVLRYRMCVAPFYIKEPMDTETIKIAKK